MSGIIQLLPFSDRLISLDIKSAGFIHALFLSVFKVKAGVEVVKTRSKGLREQSEGKAVRICPAGEALLCASSQQTRSGPKTAPYPTEHP